MGRRIGLVLYGVGVAIPIAFAVFGRWYAGVWGFSFPLDPLGVFVILLMIGPVGALFFMIGFRLRRGTDASKAKVM